MKIWLNGEPATVSADRLDSALIELGYGDCLVATALNGAFVAREGRSATRLADGDSLEVLAPLKGG